MNYYTTNLDGKSITFMASGNYLIIQDNTIQTGQPCKKIVKVEDSNDYVYKVLKTKIKAQGGAKGLYDFFVKAYEENFMNCYANAVLRAALNDVKLA